MDGLIVGLIGLVGTIVGATLVYWFDVKRGEREDRRRKTRRLAALREEIYRNRALLSANPFIQEHDLGSILGGVQLSTGTWQECKGDISELDDNLAQSLRQAYAMIEKFNGTLDHALVQPVGIASAQAARIERLYKAVVEAVENAASALGTDIRFLVP